MIGPINGYYCEYVPERCCLFNGMRVYERPWPKRQARTHRKKRINKKWLKRYGVTIDTSVDTSQVAIIAGRMMVAYPPAFAEIMRAARLRPL